MVPIIYTTYGLAMRHRLEVLTASGGLQPAATERRREQLARVAVARVRSSLSTLLVRMRVRHHNVDSQTVNAERMSAAALPGSRRLPLTMQWT